MDFGIEYELQIPKPNKYYVPPVFSLPKETLNLMLLEKLDKSYFEYFQLNEIVGQTASVKFSVKGPMPIQKKLLMDISTYNQITKLKKDKQYLAFKLYEIYSQEEFEQLVQMFIKPEDISENILKIYTGYKILSRFFNKDIINWSHKYNGLKKTQDKLFEYRVEYDQSIYKGVDKSKYISVEFITPVLNEHQVYSFFELINEFQKENNCIMTKYNGVHINISDFHYHPFNNPFPMIEYYQEEEMYKKFYRYHSYIKPVKPLLKQTRFKATKQLLKHNNAVNIREYGLEFRAPGNKPALNLDLMVKTLKHFKRCYEIFRNSR